jgi:hypothetical protein
MLNVGNYQHCAVYNRLLMAKKKDAAAVRLGRRGGKNSRKNLTDEQARELAQRAVNARWERWRAENPEKAAEGEKKRKARPTSRNKPEGKASQ